MARLRLGVIRLIGGLVKGLEGLDGGGGRLPGEFDLLTFEFEPGAVAFEAEIFETGAVRGTIQSGHEPIMARVP